MHIKLTKTIFIVLILLIPVPVVSQNFKQIKIFKKDGTELNVFGVFRYNNLNYIESVSIKKTKNDSSIKNLNLIDITKVEKENDIYETKKYNNTTFLF